MSSAFEDLNRTTRRRSIRQRPNATTTLALVFGLLVMGGFLTVMFWEAGRRERPSADRTWTRDQFRAIVQGKKETELLKVIGTPYDTSQIDDRRTLYYRKITTDPVTGNIDRQTTVYVVRGVVDGVTFSGD